MCEIRGRHTRQWVQLLRRRSSCNSGAGTGNATAEKRTNCECGWSKSGASGGERVKILLLPETNFAEVNIALKIFPFETSILKSMYRKRQELGLWNFHRAMLYATCVLNLQTVACLPFLILGSVFRHCVVFYGDIIFILSTASYASNKSVIPVTFWHVCLFWSPRRR